MNKLTLTMIAIGIVAALAIGLFIAPNLCTNFQKETGQETKTINGYCYTKNSLGDWVPINNYRG